MKVLLTITKAFLALSLFLWCCSDIAYKAGGLWKLCSSRVIKGCRCPSENLWRFCCFGWKSFRSRLDTGLLSWDRLGWIWSNLWYGELASKKTGYLGRMWNWSATFVQQGRRGRCKHPTSITIEDDSMMGRATLKVLEDGVFIWKLNIFMTR